MWLKVHAWPDSLGHEKNQKQTNKVQSAYAYSHVTTTIPVCVPATGYYFIQPLTPTGSDIALGWGVRSRIPHNIYVNVSFEMVFVPGTITIKWVEMNWNETGNLLYCPKVCTWSFS